VTYVIETSQERVGDGKPALRTRFYSRAIRRRDKLNAQRIIESYKFEVVKDGNHWEVVAFQNYLRAVPPEPDPALVHWQK
jgi:hypothetical protein